MSPSFANGRHAAGMAISRKTFALVSLDIGSTVLAQNHGCFTDFFIIGLDDSENLAFFDLFLIVLTPFLRNAHIDQATGEPPCCGAG